MKFLVKVELSPQNNLIGKYIFSFNDYFFCTWNRSCITNFYNMIILLAFTVLICDFKCIHYNSTYLIRIGTLIKQIGNRDFLKMVLLVE